MILGLDLEPDDRQRYERVRAEAVQAGLDPSRIAVGEMFRPPLRDGVPRGRVRWLRYKWVEDFEDD